MVKLIVFGVEPSGKIDSPLFFFYKIHHELTDMIKKKKHQ